MVFPLLCYNPKFNFHQIYAEGSNEVPRDFSVALNSFQQAIDLVSVSIDDLELIHIQISLAVCQDYPFQKCM